MGASDRRVAPPSGFRQGVLLPGPAVAGAIIRAPDRLQKTVASVFSSNRVDLVRNTGNQQNLVALTTLD